MCSVLVGLPDRSTRTMQWPGERYRVEGTSRLVELKSIFMSGPNLEGREGLVYVGIALAMVGACTSGFGMNLMKASNRLELDRPIYRRYRFIVGVSLATFVNTSLDCVAFALTPLVIVAPIGGITIVTSVLLARFGVAGDYEYVSWEQWVAIIAVVGGVALIDVFGPHPEPVLNTTTVLEHFHNEAFLAYETITAVVVVITYSGIWLGKLGGQNLETTVASAMTAGMCSGITMTMMKVMATCVGAWILHGSLPFWFTEFWVALITLVIVAVVLVHLLNVCISSANLALSTPLYQVCVILFTIVAACAFYQEADVATRSELLVFLLGVLAVLAGLGVLIYSREIPGQKLLPKEDKESATARAPAAPAPDDLTVEVVGVIDPEVEVDSEL